ncbi:MAG: PIN domain-containing protein [Dehalococcoidia bacterium]
MLALLNPQERRHASAKAALLADLGPYLVPAGTLCEVGYFMQKRAGVSVLDEFLEDIQTGAYRLECGEDDFGRVRELLERYADLGLSFTDAAVIACAERNGGRVLTFDRRDFDVVAREGSITILPV